MTEAVKQMRLLIIDGHAFAYRAFFAIRGLSSPSGQPTNAIYGFIKMLEKLEASFLPSHTVVVWDGGLDEDRVEGLDDYKAQRDPMPDDMEVQLDEIVSYLEANGIASVCNDGIEADDRIGQLAKRAEEEGYDVAIASSDKDFFQLINDRVKMLNPADKSGEPMDADDVEAKTGVRPHQIVDWLSLVGDAVDGIPGVPGVGPKTAAKLLGEHGTVENLYNNLDAVSSDKLRAKLEAAAEDVHRNQDLVRLKPMPQWQTALENLRPGEENYATLHAQYTRWNFRSALRELEAGAQGELL